MSDVATRGAQAVLRLLRANARMAPPARLAHYSAHPREPFNRLPPAPIRARVDATLGNEGGWPVIELRPKGREPIGRIVFLHGGAYVGDFSPGVYWRPLARIVEASGWAVSAVIYPVAPENGFRDAYPAAAQVFAALAASAPGGRCALLGDSAGGGMALALASLLPGLGIAQPERIVLLAPWLDMTLTDPLLLRYARNDVLLNLEQMGECARLWADGEPLENPLLSPIGIDVTRVAPIDVFTGDHDLLYADAVAFRSRAAAAGVSIGWHEEPGGGHVWPFWPGVDGARGLRGIAGVIAGPPVARR